MFPSKIIPVFILILLLVSGCKPSTKITKVEATSVQMIDSEDSAIASFINPYKIKLDSEMNEILAVAAIPLVKGQPESVLGNFVCDLVLSESAKQSEVKKVVKPDICLMNNGGLRTSIPEGPITLSKIYELMPFENELVIVTLKGSRIKNMLDYIAAAEGMPVAGLRMEIVNGKPKNVTINGEPFDENRNYRVVTSDYLSAGGDKMYFFAEPVSTESLNLLVRDAIVRYLKEQHKQNKKIEPKKDGRIRLND